MAKYVFLEDWRFERSGEELRLYTHYIERSSLRRNPNSVRMLEEDMEDWEKRHPKPKYTRDELLIEIAQRLNIDLI